MPIRVRLTLLVATISLVLVTGGGLWWSVQLRGSVLNSIDTSLATRATPIVEALEDAGLIVDDADLGSTLLGPRESLAQVIDPDGALSAASESVRDLMLLPTDVSLLAATGPVTFDAQIERVVELDETRLLAVPVDRPEGTWHVVVGTSLNSVNDTLRRVRFGILVGGMLVIMLSTLGTWRLAGAALRPVEELRRSAEALTEASPKTPGSMLDVPTTSDELATLAATMNQLLARLYAAIEQQQWLVADASHELRTPLAILSTELELASRPGRTEQELKGAVEASAREADRLVRLTEDLLLLARVDEQEQLLDVRVQPLEPILREFADLEGAVTSTPVVVAVQPGLTAPLDADWVHRAIENLVQNARRHASDSGPINIHADSGPDGVITIEVADRGPGFPTEFLPHAFERFRRAQDSRSRPSGGSGLGLSIVDAIARAHGGWVEAINRPQGGAAVRIHLATESRDLARASQAAREEL